MAARKKARRKTKAIATTGTSAIALPSDLQDEFAEFINRDKASAVAVGWPYLSTQGGGSVMSLSGQPVGSESGPAIEAIILGGARVNQYYTGDFIPGKPSAPSCYAIADPTWSASEVETKLAPPKDLKTKESETCDECRYNAFGSGKGNAKACKNTVRLALLPASTDDFSKADGMMLSCPPTTMKAWGGYVAPLVAIGRPVMTVVSSIEKVPAVQGSGFNFVFTTLRTIQNKEALRAILARAKGDGGAALVQPPPTGSAGGGAKTTRRRKVVKKGGKKKGARRK